MPHSGTRAFRKTGQLISAKSFHVFFKVFLFEILSDRDSWWHNSWEGAGVSYSTAWRLDSDFLCLLLLVMKS